LQYGIYFTRQIQIFSFVFNFFCQSFTTLKIIEENCKKFEVMIEIILAREICSEFFSSN